MSAEANAYRCPDLGVLPPPLRGRGGEGGSGCCTRCMRQPLPPPLTPPHKGEGNAPSAWNKRLNTKVCVAVSAANNSGASPGELRPPRRRCYSPANRNPFVFVELHGPHCHHRADAARDRAGAG